MPTLHPSDNPLSIGCLCCQQVMQTPVQGLIVELQLKVAYRIHFILMQQICRLPVPKLQFGFSALKLDCGYLEPWCEVSRVLLLTVWLSDGLCMHHRNCRHSLQHREMSFSLSIVELYKYNSLLSHTAENNASSNYEH